MTTGEGGILCFKKKNIILLLKNLETGLRNRDEHEMLGYNYRMNEIAGIMNIQLNQWIN